MCQENIPERFRQRIQAAKEQQLSELDLRNGNLTQIPVTFHLDFWQRWERSGF